MVEVQINSKGDKTISGTKEEIAFVLLELSSKPTTKQRVKSAQKKSAISASAVTEIKNARSMRDGVFKVLEVLRLDKNSNGYYTPKQVWECLQRCGFTSTGQTPVATIAEYLNGDIRNNGMNARVERGQPGSFRWKLRA